jgi:hypothetical protein
MSTEELLKQIEELKARVAALEQRPIFVPYYPPVSIPYIQPYQPYTITYTATQPTGQMLVQ